MKRRTYRRFRSETFAAPTGSPAYLLDRIPSALWRQVRHRAELERMSVRYLLLELLNRWLQDPRPMNETTARKQ